jgi:hypothetical protein
VFKVDKNGLSVGFKLYSAARRRLVSQAGGAAKRLIILLIGPTKTWLAGYTGKAKLNGNNPAGI